jgi:hypothetical protein
MTYSSMLDSAGRRRSPATLPGFHAGRAPRNKGMLYPADPPTVEEIVCVASPRPRSSSPMSALTRACANLAKGRHVMGGSQSRAHPKRATCSARPPGSRSGPPARCARSMSGRVLAGERRWRSSRPLSVLFWHLLTREEDYAFGRPSLTRRKLRALELKTEEGWGEVAIRARAFTRPRRSVSTSASSPSRSRPPTAGSPRTGSPSHREAVRARHGGAHFQVIFLAKRQQRGRDQPQNLRFSSSSPAPRATLAQTRNIVQSP